MSFSFPDRTGTDIRAVARSRFEYRIGVLLQEEIRRPRERAYELAHVRRDLKTYSLRNLCHSECLMTMSTQHNEERTFQREYKFTEEPTHVHEIFCPPGSCILC